MLSFVFSSPGPIAFHLGGLTVRWYGIMIALGFLVATWCSTPLCKRRGIDPDQLINCALVCFVAGIIGARLYFVALTWQHFAEHPEQIFATWLGGLSIHGGIIGGVIAGAIFCKTTKMPFWSGSDVAACILPLAQAIGRWGNFFNSEAFGRPTPADFPLKLYIPPENRPSEFAGSEYFHPTFLYESLWDLAIWALLYFFVFNRLRAFPGATFFAYLFLYSVGRFLIEPMRTDSIMFGPLPAPYVVSAVLMALAAVGFLLTIVTRKKSASPPQQ